MPDIELVIKIPEQIYVAIRKTDVIISDQRNGKSLMGKALMSIILNAIAKGIRLPKGHGRLIDADALIYGYELADFVGDEYDCLNTACHVVNSAPTIIEADKSEEGKT